MKRFLKAFLVLLVCALPFTLNVDASSPYYTQTLNRYGDWIETQDAYEPTHMIKVLSDGSTFKNAQDMFIDEDDYLYVADTGNKRIVILNKDQELVTVIEKNDEDTNYFTKPTGIAVRDGLIYVADYGTVADEASGRIFIFSYDKTNHTATYVKEWGRPTSAILEIDNFKYRPQKITVDKNHTMFVISEGSTSGVMMINSNNRFINFFAPNNVEATLWDRIKYLLYSNNENVILEKKVPTAPTNIMLDNTGYIYTLTSKTNEKNIGDNFKKVNVGGMNFFPTDMNVAGNLVDSWYGGVENTYVVTSSGYIYEYDNQGNVLFLFGGSGIGNDQLGLFGSASSIVADSNNNLLIMDNARNNIQVLRRTNFAKQVHDALALYNDAKYLEAMDVWENVLQYNSMFDMAHKGIGLAYYMSGDYEKALEKFEISYAKKEYSDAYWEIRNEWLLNNTSTAIVVVAALFALLFVIKLTNKKFGYLNPVSKAIKRTKQLPFIKEFLYMFYFIKNPADYCYEIRANKRVGILTTIFAIFVLLAIYVVSLFGVGFLFNNTIIEETNLIKELLSLIIPLVAFVVSNYLMSALMEGEGTFRNVFINVVSALTPIIIVYPILIILSNYLTNAEGFLYSFGVIVMVGWSAINVFAAIKETHNYNMKETFTNIFLTIVAMLILILVLVMVFIMIIQVYSFVEGVIKEVIISG